MKQRLIATGVIVVAWAVLDMLFHGVLLSAEYTATAALLRPMEEMKMLLMHGVSLIQALLFTLIYCQLVKEKSIEKGLKLGALVGLLVGVGASLGSYTYMPITVKITAVWFISMLVNYVVAGAIVGKFVTKELSEG